MRRIMHLLSLGKIAAVDKPCQEGALAVITKRAPEINDGAFESLCKRTFSAEQRREAAAKGHAMQNGSYPIENKSDLENAIHAVGRGKSSHASIRSHIMRRAKALGASDMIPESWHDGGKVKKSLVDAFAKAGIQLASPDGDEGAEDFDEALEEQCLTQAFWDAYYKATCALQTSLVTIMGDETITDKSALVTQTLQQFADHIEGILPSPIGKSLAAGIAAIAGGAGTTSQGESMDAIRKALGLPATATEADIVKAMEENKKKAEEHDKEEKRRSRIAKMSEKHTDYMNHPKAELPKGGKEAFADMEPHERDSHIEAHPIEDDDEVEKMLKRGDAFKAINGQVITKRQAGAMFDLLKSQDADIRKSKDDIAKAHEREAIAAFEKRATDLGFPKEFGATMRKAYSGDAAAQAEVEKQMSALRKQVEKGKLFGEVGKSSAETGTAYAELMAKAEELRKSSPKLTQAQAFEKVYTDRSNVEIVKRYKAESRAN